MTNGRDGLLELWVFELAYLSFCVVSFVWLTPGFRSARSHTFLQDFILLLNVVAGAMAFYAFLQRMPVAWRLGWLVIGLAFSEWFALIFATLPKVRSQQRWATSALFLVVGSVVVLVWAYRWKGKKKYLVHE